MPAVVPQSFSSAQLTGTRDNIFIREKNLGEHQCDAGPVATALLFQLFPAMCWKIIFPDFDCARHVLHVCARPLVHYRLISPMAPEEGQNLRLVKDGEICGNPNPHLDIEDRDQIRSETAKLLISRPPNHPCRTLTAAAFRHAFQPTTHPAWVDLSSGASSFQWPFASLIA